MTPFDSWYAANIEPSIPTDAPKEARVAAKSSAANIWNAALDACDAIAAERAPAAVHFKDLLTKDLRARVTP